MKTVLKRFQIHVAKFRVDRHIDIETQRANIKNTVNEENEERYVADTVDDVIDSVCDAIVYMTNALGDDFNVDEIENSYNTDYDIDPEELNRAYLAVIEVGYIPSVLNTSIGTMLRYLDTFGYEWKGCLEEVLKVINSREQDPEQKAKWEKGEFEVEKWKKNSNQDPSTLYTANYQQHKKK